MKALPFIEAIGNQIEAVMGHIMAGAGSYSVNDKQKGSELCSLGRQEAGRITALREFYLQPFEPEMILHYFEGWKKLPTNGIITVENNKGDSFMFHKSEYIRLKKGSFPPVSFSIVKTIDEFISDMQRIGIELEWKEEIVEKYFK